MQALILLLLSLIAVVLAQITDFSPSQIHIALAGIDDNGDHNKMTVSWHTTNDTSTSILKYGTKSGVYDATSIGISKSYYQTFHHHVTTDVLSPSTTYYYVVGDETGGFSEEKKFKSAPTSSSLRSNFKFAVFGDLGSVNGDSTISYMTSQKDGLEFISHAGDVGYADDSFLHQGCFFDFCYEDSYATYMNSIEPWASQIPYMVAVGNHEVECHDASCLFNKERREKMSNFTTYNTRFAMPSAESNGVLNMWYSFNYGNVHVINVNTETDYPGAPEESRYVLPCGGFGDQLTWLEQDLQSIDRTVRPWVFAVGHHPMYQGSSSNSQLIAAMENLFYTYGVDIFFTGHVHSYERDYPVYQGIPELTYVNPRATTHILVGGAGNDEMHVSPLPKLTSVTPSVDTHVEGAGKWREDPYGATGPWTVAQDSNYGIGIVTITDDSTLTFDYHRTKSGLIKDSVTLTRDHSIYVRK